MINSFKVFVAQTLNCVALKLFNCISYYDLPHEIKIDISKFTEFDKPFQVKDIVLPEGVELLHELEDVIALVQAPRTEEELEELSTEATEDVSAVEGVKEEVPAEEGETVAEESKE